MMDESAESVRGIGHYKIATFSCLNGIYIFSTCLALPGAIHTLLLKMYKVHVEIFTHTCFGPFFVKLLSL